MRRWTRIALAGSFLALLTLLAACGQPGLSAEEAEELRNDVDRIEGRLDELSEQLTAIEEEEEDPAEVASERRGYVEDVMHPNASRSVNASLVHAHA